MISEGMVRVPKLLVLRVKHDGLPELGRMKKADP